MRAKPSRRHIPVMPFSDDWCDLVPWLRIGVPCVAGTAPAAAAALHVCRHWAHPFCVSGSAWLRCLLRLRLLRRYLSRPRRRRVVVAKRAAACERGWRTATAARAAVMRVQVRPRRSIVRSKCVFVCNAYLRWRTLVLRRASRASLQARGLSTAWHRRQQRNDRSATPSATPTRSVRRKRRSPQRRMMRPGVRQLRRRLRSQLPRQQARRQQRCL